MHIEKVTAENIHLAAYIHRESWKNSHKSFVSVQALEKRTVERQTAYLQQQIDSGKAVYMLTDGIPVGVVSVYGNIIENLYILPENKDRVMAAGCFHLQYPNAPAPPPLQYCPITVP